MHVMFTPSARLQLLELVATLRSADRNRAARFVDAVEARLESLAEGADSGRSVSLVDRMPNGTDAVRLCFWVRSDVLWVLAFSPDMTPGA